MYKIITNDNPKGVEYVSPAELETDIKQHLNFIKEGIIKWFKVISL